MLKSQRWQDRESLWTALDRTRELALIKRRTVTIGARLTGLLEWADICSAMLDPKHPGNYTTKLSSLRARGDYKGITIRLQDMLKELMNSSSEGRVDR